MNHATDRPGNVDRKKMNTPEKLVTKNWQKFQHVTNYQLLKT